MPGFIFIVSYPMKWRKGGFGIPMSFATHNPRLMSPHVSILKYYNELVLSTSMLNSLSLMQYYHWVVRGSSLGFIAKIRRR